jgi:hypothetical protein
MNPTFAKTHKHVFVISLVSCTALFVSLGRATPAGTTPENAVPVAYSQTIGVSLNSPPKDITLNATDADGNPLSFIIVSGPAYGSLVQVNGSLWQYTRAVNYQGPDSFSFKVNDGVADSNVASVQIVNSPHGIFQMTGGTPWQTNPNVDGLHLGIKWSAIAVTEDPSRWKWNSIDSQLQNAVLYHKQVGISLKILSDPPGWLQTTYGVPKYLVPKVGGNAFSMVLPWDPIVKEKVDQFISELGHHITSARYGSLPLDGTAVFVIMGGLGIQTETHMPAPTTTTPHIPDPNNPSNDISIDDELALWQQSSKDFIDTYAANFHATPYIIAASIPIDEDVPASTTSLTDVSCYGIGASSSDCVGTGYQGFGALFGVMSWGLNENSSTDFIVNEWISTNSPTNSTGFQFGSAYGGLIDPSPVLNQALEMNAHFVEVYPVDADGAYAATIHSYAPLLKW